MIFWLWMRDREKLTSQWIKYGMSWVLTFWAGYQMTNMKLQKKKALKIKARMLDAAETDEERIGI